MTDLAGHYGVVQVPGFFGQAISMATGHWANHTFIVLPGNMVLEAWVPFAHIRPLSDYDGHQLLFNDHERITKRQRQKIVEFAESAVGWHYDYLHFGVLTLYHLFGLDTFGRIPRLGTSAICSKLVVMAGQAAGLDWSNGLDINRVTPAHLARRIEDAKAIRQPAQLSIA